MLLLTNYSPKPSKHHCFVQIRLNFIRINRWNCHAMEPLNTICETDIYFTPKEKNTIIIRFYA